METAIAICVPRQDASDLAELLQATGGDPTDLQTTRPFDGEGVVQSLVVISLATFPYFKSWMTQRAAARKSFSIIHEGIELRGYSAHEAAKVIETLQTIIAEEGSTSGSQELNRRASSD
jgi:hypothetical protein